MVAFVLERPWLHADAVRPCVPLSSSRALLLAGYMALLSFNELLTKTAMPFRGPI